MKRQLLVSVAVLGAAHAGDSRHARQPARLRDEPARLTGDDVESPARHGARRASGDARSVAPRASVAGRRRRRQRPIEDDQRAVGPPGPERGVNLQPERPRPAETGGATEPLKRDERPHAEGKVHDVGDAARLERVARGARRPPARCTGRADSGAPSTGLGPAIEAIEERRSARADDQRAGSAGQQLIEGERPRRDVERRAASAGERRSAPAQPADARAPRADRRMNRRPTIATFATSCAPT